MDRNKKGDVMARYRIEDALASLSEDRAREYAHYYVKRHFDLEHTAACKYGHAACANYDGGPCEDEQAGICGCGECVGNS